MKHYDRLSPEERAEVDAAVHDAYMCDDGTIRPHAEADKRFSHFVDDAIQAHREWPDILIDAWQEEGRRAFLKSRWSNAKIFDVVHKGKIRKRRERRGTRVRDDDGGMVWIKEPLVDWTAEQLQAGIREGGGRIEEERVNIAMFRALLDLLEGSGCATPREALEARGMTLEEYLASRDAA